MAVIYRVFFCCSGVKLCEVYDAAVELVKDQKPDFVDKLTKSVGYEHNSRSLAVKARDVRRAY